MSGIDPEPVARARRSARCPPPGGGVGVNVWSCVSINDLTVRMAWIAGLAVVGLVLAGWRKTARAQPKRPRSPYETPRRVPYQVAEAVAPPYHPAGPLRRVWSVVASSGLALVIGAIIATVTAFALAWIVTTLTDLLRAVTDRRAVAIAGHTGDVTTAAAGSAHDDPACGRPPLGALQRLGALDGRHADRGARRPRRRPCGGGRRRSRPAIRTSTCTVALADDEPSVVEVAAWACGEREVVGDEILAMLVGLAGGAGAGREPLVREAAVAALGAIGDDRGLDAILAATSDKPAIRRRAVLALAPFVGARPPPGRRGRGGPRAGAHRPRLAGPPGGRGPRRDRHPDEP